MRLRLVSAVYPSARAVKFSDMDRGPVLLMPPATGAGTWGRGGSSRNQGKGGSVLGSAVGDVTAQLLGGNEMGRTLDAGSGRCVYWE